MLFLLKNRKMTDDQLLQIAQDVATPVYVYDAERIRFQYHRLKNAFPGVEVKLNYAMKALSNRSILQLLLQEGSGCDAVAIEEVHLALRAGFLPQDILYTPNGVSFEEIQQAVELGVRINVDNLAVLELFGAAYGDRVPCCVRVNPHIMAGGNAHISVGHIDSKFGISIYQIKHVQRIVKHFGIHVNGLHMHTGSDIIDSGAFLRGAELLYEAAEHFPELEFLDFGSGFKVAYKEGDIVTDIESIGKEIAKSFQKFCKSYGRNIELWFEPGKFLVSESGVLLVSANTVKQTTSTVFVGVNSGQNHLIRPMFYDAYHHIRNISNTAGPVRLYSIVGYICESDTLGYDRMLDEVSIGDVLAISNAGAYGFSMSNNYNSRLRPAEVLVDGDNYRLIRKRETLEDLLRNEVGYDN